MLRLTQTSNHDLAQLNWNDATRRASKVCSSWFEISIDSRFKTSHDDFDSTCRDSIQFVRWAALSLLFAFLSCSFHAFVWLHREYKNAMRRTNDSHVDACEIALRADFLSCLNAHTIATSTAWDAAWVLWIFVSRLSNKDVVKQNVLEEFSWKIFRSNFHSRIHIFDFIRQKCRLLITSAHIEHDRDSCDKSQNVLRKFAYIYEEKYSIHVEFSFDKNQISSRLCCVHREKCFEERSRITKQIRSNVSFSKRVCSTFWKWCEECFLRKHFLFCEQKFWWKYLESTKSKRQKTFRLRRRLIRRETHRLKRRLCCAEDQLAHHRWHAVFSNQRHLHRDRHENYFSHSESVCFDCWAIDFDRSETKCRQSWTFHDLSANEWRESFALRMRVLRERKHSSQMWRETKEFEWYRCILSLQVWMTINMLRLHLIKSVIHEIIKNQINRVFFLLNSTSYLIMNLMLHVCESKTSHVSIDRFAFCLNLFARISFHVRRWIRKRRKRSIFIIEFCESYDASNKR